MAGIVAVIVKIMPEAPDTDLEAIKHEAKKCLESHGAKNISFEVKPYAFGLNAIFAKFAWPEEKDTNLFEDALAEIKDVATAVTSDYRRAFG